MTVDELVQFFRMDTSDTIEPFLWSDVEVLVYANEARDQFVRMTGGISDELQIPVVKGVATATVPSTVLNFRYAYLTYNNTKLSFVNEGELPTPNYGYGIQSGAVTDPRSGRVTAIEIGNQPDVIRWIPRPMEDDTCTVGVYRLPKNALVRGGEITEVQAHHHRRLVDYMKGLAYAKHDAETLQNAKSSQYKQEFAMYCEQCVGERERYRSHSRVVTYGGL
jgi:hypothetical protein